MADACAVPSMLVLYYTVLMRLFRPSAAGALGDEGGSCPGRGPERRFFAYTSGERAQRFAGGGSSEKRLGYTLDNQN